MALARVALKFAEFPDGELSTFTDTIIAGLTGNAKFPSPPVTLLDLQAHLDDFTAKIADANMGGEMDTAAKDAARQVLIGDLRQIALYVELESENDMAILLSSGFEARSTERQSLPLDKPVGLTVTNLDVGKLNAKVDRVKNCSMYEGRAKADGAADWNESVFSGDSRKIVLDGLTPGVMYSVQVRALGGSTGTSPWSDSAMHRSL